MNIIVCLKIVSQATFSDSLTDNDDRLSGGRLSINPADRYALELALRIKDNDPGTMVTVVTMAPAYAESSLRDAIAAGADRAVIVCDSALAGSDTLITANILASSIRMLGSFDLVLCGRKAIDSETGHIAPQLSERLGLPIATVITAFNVQNGTLHICRTSDGVSAEFTGKMPAILSICNGTDMVRNPTIMGMRRSKSVSIERLTLSDIGIPAESVGLTGSPTRTAAVETMSFRKGKKSVCTDAEVGALTLLELIRGGRDGE